MSAVHAIENAFNITIGGALRDLRRLVYCGEWISSHALHIFMLHAPDFLGYESAIHMAKDFPEKVEQGLQLKKVGGMLMSLVGGGKFTPSIFGWVVFTVLPVNKNYKRSCQH